MKRIPAAQKGIQQARKNIQNDFSCGLLPAVFLTDNITKKERVEWHNKN